MEDLVLRSWFGQSFWARICLYCSFPIRCRRCRWFAAVGCDLWSSSRRVGLCRWFIENVTTLHHIISYTPKSPFNLLRKLVLLNYLYVSLFTQRLGALRSSRQVRMYRSRSTKRSCQRLHQGAWRTGIWSTSLKSRSDSGSGDTIRWSLVYRC